MKKYIWGTGRLVGKVVDRYISLDDIEGFIDNNNKKQIYMGKKVFSPYEMLDKEYDAIIVANLYSKEIYEQCIKIGIDTKKLIFLYANCQLTDMNGDYLFISDIMGEEYANIIKNRYHIVRDLDVKNKSFFQNLNDEKQNYKETDWIRIKIFELVVKEINKRNLMGSVAELGVYKGEFAQFINYAFPNDKLYLFDTFEGFDEDEAVKEIKNENCTESFVMAYKNTSINTVLDKMTNIDKVNIVQGYFPNSLNGLEDKFKFVSIDCDFEESIYQGLRYFYPRLIKGGYIFIHDYSSILSGVEKAVDRYEKEFGEICKVPVCDANGTLIITK